MTFPCIGVCKLDTSIGRCLTLTALGKGVRRNDETRERALALL
jgi:hypothetical protein